MNNQQNNREIGPIQTGIQMENSITVFVLAFHVASRAFTNVFVFNILSDSDTSFQMKSQSFLL